MRKASFAMILGFAFLIGFALLLGQSVFVLQRVARVSDVSGAVNIIHKGEENTIPLGERRLVQAGDRLSTEGMEGRCTLNWIDGTRIRMEPASELTVQKCQVNRGAEQAAFRLDIGKIWIRVLRVLSQQDKFLINTPTATAGVRGTMFAVEVAADGATEISVYEGQVTVADDSGEVKVVANTVAWLGRGQAGPQVTAFSAQQQEIWQQQMQHLGPYLVLTSPDNNAEFLGDTITVEGRCERGANLTVNDQAVTQKPNGRFTIELEVPAYAKHFTVEAVATDRKGYSTTVRRHLVQLVHEELLAPVSPEPGTTE
ncbi:MAG: FecR domain-containing protein [Armatimonadetes bacterium]|nr:FecR domain-containing protein [Armatimonadota bacterium]